MKQTSVKIGTKVKITNGKYAGFTGSLVKRNHRLDWARCTVEVRFNYCGAILNRTLPTGYVALA
jgi:hypothetical protein